ncbi:MAG TPA: IncP-type conjugal transfer protein TraG [Myxococcota bacterium]|nr:IncP-type conjugal transfer protein TraG [Myxococcota bacterium]
MPSSPDLYRLPQASPGSATGIYTRSFGAAFLLILIAFWATTQWTAWRLHFAPALGTPWLALSPPLRALSWLMAIAGFGLALLVLWWPGLRWTSFLFAAVALLALSLAVGLLYAPWAFFLWDWRFGKNPRVAPIFQTGHWLIAIPAHATVLVAMLVSSRQAKRLSGQTDSHGSAKWASADEVRRADLLHSEGLFLARWRDPRRKRHPAYLRYEGPQHVLGFAPSRSGKGVGWVLPTLLTWSGSVLVHDIKGENWALSSGWRKEALGSLCLRFDPTCKDGSAARFNPLLEIRLGPNEVRDAQNVADMLVDPDGRGAKDHWDLTAEELLVGAILHVLYVGREKSLRGCLDLLSHPTRPIANVLNEMVDTEHDPAGERGWRDRSTGERTKIHPVVAGAARAVMNKSENERSSVISSAVKCLSLFRDEVVAENTSACDFRITDLVQQERPVSFYLTVPPSDLSRTRPLVRLLIQQVGRRLTESLHFEDGRAVSQTRHRLLFLMDEFPSLGRLEFFETQLAFLAGYGVQAFLIVQDLSQLYAAYGRNESIISNCGIRVAFAPNRIETARLLSDMAGTMTVHRSRRMYSGHRLSPWLSHVMASEEESQRTLLTPDEALRLPEDVTLVFRAGHRPIYAEKLRYYEDPRLLARARIPAPQVSDRISRDAGSRHSDPREGANHLRSSPALEQPTMTAPHPLGSKPGHWIRASGSTNPCLRDLPDTEDLLK